MASSLREATLNKYRSLIAWADTVSEDDVREQSISSYMKHQAGVGIDTNSCPLCMKFRFNGDNPCKGCPVRARTGRRYCERTPWVGIYSTVCAYNLKAFRKALRKELVFLETLDYPED